MVLENMECFPSRYMKGDTLVTGIYKMSLEHLLVPESKEVFKTKNKTPTMIGVWQGDIEAN